MSAPKHEVVAFAECIERGRAVLMSNPVEFVILWLPEGGQDTTNAIPIQTIEIPQVMLGEFNAYIEALKAMIELAVRR